MNIRKYCLIAALFLLTVPVQYADAEEEIDKTTAATHHYLHRKKVNVKNAVYHTGAHMHNYAHRNHAHTREWLNSH